MGIIHFADLDEMLAELSDGQIVRVSVLDVTEGTAEKYGIRLASIGVHVRAFNDDGHVLSCYIPVKRLQVIGRVPPAAQRGEYDSAWNDAENEAARVRAYLTQRGFEVRPGVIDLGDARPMAGGWNPPEAD